MTTADPADDSDPDLKIPGPLRRHWPLALVIAASAMVGPALSRYLHTYRAVVLEVRGDQMLIAQTTRPPTWIDADLAEVVAGDFLLKEMAAWSPSKTAYEGTQQDVDLREMYKRYTRHYEGIITAINPPVVAGGASTAVITLDDGGKVFVPLWAEHLAGAAVGRHIRKEAGTWDPVLVDSMPAPTQPN